MKKLILFFFIALFSTGLVAQKRYDEIKYPELGEFLQPQVEEFTLDNGITFYIVEDRELPLIRINAIVRTGDIIEPDDKVGLASMTGTVMREGGSVNYPADELNKLLEDNAAFMSTSIGQGRGSASLNMLKEDADELLPAFVDLLQNPLFPEDKIELAKTQTRSAISRRNDSQQGIGSREFRDLIYGDASVYGRDTEYETINNITREDLIEFHKQAFVGGNMMIGVIGDFDTEEMKEKLRDAFGSIERGQETNLIYPEADYDFTSTINFIDKPDVNQSYVTLGHIGGLRENPDYAELQVMNEVLSGGFSGRLFQKVRTDLGLAYAVGGGYRSNVNYSGQFSITVMTKSSTTAEAIDAIIAELKRLQNEPITEQELKDAKDSFLNSLVFRYDSKNKILNEKINNEYLGLPEDAFDKYVEEVKSTTIEDVQRVAREYLRPEKLQILVVGNKQEIGDQLQKYGQVNEIDITIPQPSSGEDEVAGDAAKGEEWLKKMADAIIESGKEVKTIHIVSNTTQKTPMGDVNIGLDATINYNENAVDATLSTPQGSFDVAYKNGGGTLKMGGQEQPLPPPFIPIFKQLLNSGYMAAAVRQSTLEAEYLGTEEIDGKEHVLLKVQFENPQTFYINSETGLPAQIRYTQMVQGNSTKVQQHLSDWKKVDGVYQAYMQTGYANDEESNKTVIESHSVENN